MLDEDTNFDPVAENEKAERRWYESCERLGTTHLWKPVREEIANYVREFLDWEGAYRRTLRRLAVVDTLEAVAIVVLFLIAMR